MFKIVAWVFVAGIFIASFFLFFTAGDALKVHFIDVGYGDAILTQTPDGQIILIDSGDAKHADHLVGYLISHRIESIDIAILTHPHENHFGGFFSLVEKIPIRQFYINGDAQRAEEGYASLMDAIKNANIPVSVLREGDEVSLRGAGTRLKVLHPARLDKSANENSLVLLFAFKETSFLLTSDIQPLQQDDLLARYPELKSTKGVQVPHHGGRISDRFANFFARDTSFIVSTGTNKHEKPFARELNKLEGKIFRTDLQGAIILKSDGRQIKVAHD